MVRRFINYKHNMEKKKYTSPLLQIITIPDSDLIVTSNYGELPIGGPNDGPLDARQRRTSIWDDEF